MEVLVIEITEKMEKKIRRYLSKWKVRKTGAPVWQIAGAVGADLETVQYHLDWMFRYGKVTITRTMNGYGYYEEPHYHA